jgi:hypothetical protein
MAEPVPAGWTQPDADLYAVLTAPFERYHEDKRAGVSFRYITGEQCETRLNQAFGPLGWSFEITDRWVDAEADEVVVQGKLTVYRTVRLLETIPDTVEGGDVTVYREVVQAITRTQIGSHKIARKKRYMLNPQQYDDLFPNKKAEFVQGDNGMWTNLDAGTILDVGFNWKSAGTDCLKKCASLFGVALELYNRDTQNKALAPVKRPQAPRTPPQNARPPQQSPAPVKAPSDPAQGQSAAFTPPFRMVAKKDEHACVAYGCDIVINPTFEYTSQDGAVTRKGDYIIEQSKAQCRYVLCVDHVLEFINAKKKASKKAA